MYNIIYQSHGSIWEWNDPYYLIAIERTCIDPQKPSGAIPDSLDCATHYLGAHRPLPSYSWNMAVCKRITPFPKLLAFFDIKKHPWKHWCERVAFQT